MKTITDLSFRQFGRLKEHTIRTEELFEECGVAYTVLENWA